MQVHPEHVEKAAAASGGFLPHGFCYLWNPGLLWTHVIADVLIGLSYVAISAALVWLVVRGRREFPFQWMFVAFGLFILACGATHFIEVWTLWEPRYWVSAWMKVVTAAASVTTALLLPPLIPKVLSTLRDARLSEERRVLAERASALVESEERFRTLAEALPHIVWTAGPDGAVDYYNQRWFDFTGIPREEGVGWGWRNPLHPDDVAPTMEAWTRSVKTGEPYELEHRMRGVDGGYRWVLSRGVPVRGRDGAVVKWFGSGTDIHHQKVANEELRRARDAAEAGSRARDQFMAVMSHELRTPLNAVLGYSELMGDGLAGPVTPKQHEQLGRIRSNTAHLLGLIDQILGFARDEAGHATPRPERVSAAAVLREAVDAVEPLARARGLALSADLPAGAPEVVTDGGMLRQIGMNLLSNAVRFTDAGSVSLTVRVEGGELRMEVADTGVGIAPEHREKVFEPFWQVDQSLTRAAGGTGLGLAITRRMVLALGGEIELESAPGRGSRFTVRLPVSPRTVPFTGSPEHAGPAAASPARE
jgi:PAS domain S-box-containing protein